MKYISPFSLVVVLLAACHFESQSTTLEGLTRERARKAFGISLLSGGYQNDIKSLSEKFAPGSSIGDIRRELRRIEKSQVGCRLLENEARLDEKRSLLTFYVFHKLSGQDKAFVYEFGFHFEDGKLAKIDYSQVTMAYSDFVK